MDVVCSAIYATLDRVSPAPSPLSLRLGQDGQDALQEIARRRGISRAEAARQAIRETAARDRLRNGLAAEAQRLMEDPAYIHEVREVAAMMDELRDPG
jgi:predicted transcriptional regulator